MMAADWKKYSFDAELDEDIAMTLLILHNQKTIYSPPSDLTAATTFELASRIVHSPHVVREAFLQLANQGHLQESGKPRPQWPTQEGDQAKPKRKLDDFNSKKNKKVAIC